MPQLCSLSRQQLRNTDKTLLHKGKSAFQADLYKVTVDGRDIVVKDFLRCPAIARKTVCRYIVAQEVKALKHLDCIEAVPSYLGNIDINAYMMVYIEGQQISSRKKYDESLFNDINNAISHMHSLGMTHNDLHRRNILVDNNNKPYLIDFASTVYRTERKGPYGWIKNTFFHFLEKIDNAKVVRLKLAYIDNYEMTDEEKKLVTHKMRYRKISRFWKEYINKPLIRKSTWQRRVAWLKDKLK